MLPDVYNFFLVCFPVRNDHYKKNQRETIDLWRLKLNSKQTYGRTVGRIGVVCLLLYHSNAQKCCSQVSAPTPNSNVSMPYATWQCTYPTFIGIKNIRQGKKKYIIFWTRNSPNSGNIRRITNSNVTKCLPLLVQNHFLESVNFEDISSSHWILS